MCLNQFTSFKTKKKTYLLDRVDVAVRCKVR